MNKLENLKQLLKSLNQETTRVLLLRLLAQGELDKLAYVTIGTLMYIRSSNPDLIILNKVKILLS